MIATPTLETESQKKLRKQGKTWKTSVKKIRQGSLFCITLKDIEQIENKPTIDEGGRKGRAFKLVASSMYQCKCSRVVPNTNFI